MPFDPSAYLAATVGKMKCKITALPEDAHKTFMGFMASADGDIQNYLADGDKNPIDLLVKVVDSLRPVMGTAHFAGVLAKMMGSPGDGVDSKMLAKTVALIAVTATAVLKDLAFVDYRLMMSNDCTDCVMSKDCEKAKGEKGSEDGKQG